MDALSTIEYIKSKNQKLIEHKVKILEERVYWMCVDKIFEAQEYADYEVDKHNNIYITYSLKKDESIIENSHDYIISEILSIYRKNLKFRLTKNNYYVLFKNDEIVIFLSEPSTIKSIDSESDSDSESIGTLIKSDQNLNIYKNENAIEFGTIIDVHDDV